MILAVLVRETLNGRNFVIPGLYRKHQARAYGLAVEQHRAGATDAVLAADMGAGEDEIVATA